MNDTHSLSHTKWNCNYHIVFAPKCRGMPRPCTYAFRDTDKDEYIKFYGIFEREKQLDDIWKVGNLKFKYRNREFWCKGYYVDAAGKNAVKIKEYIKNQLKEDELGEQLTFNNTNPFMGSE